MDAFVSVCVGGKWNVTNWRAREILEGLFFTLLFSGGGDGEERRERARIKMDKKSFEK
jgi:hypothetical protein